MPPIPLPDDESGAAAEGDGSDDEDGLGGVAAALVVSAELVVSPAAVVSAAVVWEVPPAESALVPTVVSDRLSRPTRRALRIRDRVDLDTGPMVIRPDCTASKPGTKPRPVFT